MLPCSLLLRLPAHPSLLEILLAVGINVAYAAILGFYAGYATHKWVGRPVLRGYQQMAFRIEVAKQALALHNGEDKIVGRRAENSIIYERLHQLAFAVDNAPLRALPHKQ